MCHGNSLITEVLFYHFYLPLLQILRVFFTTMCAACELLNKSSLCLDSTYSCYKEYQANQFLWL